jgi:hypothetical protein
MKPNNYTEEYPTRYGRFYDWTSGGTPGSYYWLDDFTAFYNMPINHNHEKDPKSGRFLEGGSWLAYSRTVVNDGEEAETYRNSWDVAYKGRYHITTGWTSEQFSEAKLLELFYETRDYGAEAWNAMRPDQPDFSLAVSLYELRETPRLLQQSLSVLIRRMRQHDVIWRWGKPKVIRLRKPRQTKASWAGSWYLAINFGWLPLYRDIRNYSEAFDKKHKRLDQLIRDEGKPVKRYRSLGSETSDPLVKLNLYSTPSNPDIRPTHVTQCYKSGRESRTERTVQTTVTTWAEGVFRYHLPKGPRTEGWKKQMYQRIMGGRLTPTAVYNIMPWSWLVDYFADLGEFVEAVSPGVADNLYADYAYVMRQVKETYSVVSNQATISSKSGNFKRPKAFKVVTNNVKIRVKATPFGFGLNEDNLSLKQHAILGALGLSRLPKG